MGATELRVIDGETVRRLASPGDLIEAMREAMAAASRGDVELPLRQAMVLPDGRGMLGIMPGYLGSAGAAGVKLVSLVPPAKRQGRSSHLGVMVLYEAEGIVPVAILCGSTLTALRTAAASALATDVLARPDAKVLAVLGAGEQAHAHMDALPEVRRFGEFRVWNHRPEKARAFAAAQKSEKGRDVRVCAKVAEAVAGADVICTVTGAPDPILPGDLVAPGTHVNLVGASLPQFAEADDALVAKARFFVDYRASAFAQAGELLGAIERGVVGKDHVQGEIGEVILGRVPGRRAATDVTLYKSLGIAAQDLAAARLVLARAEAQGLGVRASL